MLRRHWPIAVVLLAQLGILAAIPARHIRARLSGTPVTLRTEPVDPFDVMSGYHVRLRYEVENAATAQLGTPPARGSIWWIVVRRAEPAWEFVSVGLEHTSPTADTVALKAEWRDDFRGLALVGAGRLYVPEEQRLEAERHERDYALVDMKVGPDGTIAVVRLRSGDAVFGD